MNGIEASILQRASPHMTKSKANVTSSTNQAIREIVKTRTGSVTGIVDALTNISTEPSARIAKNPSTISVAVKVHSLGTSVSTRFCLDYAFFSTQVLSTGTLSIARLGDGLAGAVAQPLTLFTSNIIIFTFAAASQEVSNFTGIVTRLFKC